MKKLLLVSAAISLASCTQRGCQSLEREMQYTERKYNVTMYSGGDPVYTDSFKGYINQEDKGDGVYYYKGDTLVEVSGDYVIKSIK